MLVRNLVTCLACGQRYALRYGVGIGLEQRLAWPCPLCQAETRAHLSVKSKDVEADFKSDDVKIHKEHPDKGCIGVNVYSEIPVHKSSQGKGLGDGGSAWLRLMEFVEPTRYIEYAQSKEAMQFLRENIFPLVRRAATHYKRENWAELEKQVAQFAIGSDLRTCISGISSCDSGIT
jgi:hypothetical protein